MALGSQFIELFKIGGTATVDTAPMVRNLSEAEKSAKAFASKLTSIGKSMSIAFTVPLTALAVKSLAAIEEHNKAVAQTAAVLKSTGGAAGVTEAAMDALTKTLGKQLAVDDDLVRTGANLLLTFQNIHNEVGEGNDVFNQAVAVMMDYAAATGSDAAGAAATLGKALNSPLRGLMLLTRAGAVFTDEQKAQVEAMVAAGDVMGAQKIILAQLTAMYGGSAEAQITASQRIATAFDALSESIGQQLLPYYEKFASVGETAVGVFEQFPEPVKQFAVALGGVVAMTGPFLAALGTIVSGFIAAAAAAEVAILPLLGFVALATATAAAAGILGYYLGGKLSEALYGTAEIASTDLNPAIVDLGKSSASTSKKVKGMVTEIRKMANDGSMPTWTIAVEQMEQALKNGTVTADEAARVLGEVMPQRLKDLGYSAENMVASWVGSMQKMEGSLVHADGAFVRFVGLTEGRFRDWARNVSNNISGVADAFSGITGESTVADVKKALNDRKTALAQFGDNVKRVTDKLFDSGVTGAFAEQTIKRLLDFPNAEEVFAALSDASAADLRDIAIAMRDIRTEQKELPANAGKYADELHQAYLWAKKLATLWLPFSAPVISRLIAKNQREGIIPQGASGALVSRPTLALIGEAGPEAVVPLNQMPGASPLPAGGGSNLTVNVVLDRKTFARQQDYYSRASGL